MPAAPTTENTGPNATKSRATASVYTVLKLHQRPRGAVNTSSQTSQSLGALPAEFYEIVATVEATNYKTAIAKHCEANKDATDLDGNYIAVKADDWRPIPVAAKRETILSFGDVTT